MNDKREKLIKAEEKALQLFNAIEEGGLICSGISENELNTRIFKLAKELLGIEKYWHKRIVRAGKNTLLPYHENPPNLILQEDEILFLDFGPIFEEWEADFGRTFVIGNNPDKIKLRDDVEKAWHETQHWVTNKTQLTGSELYFYACGLAKKYGWEFGGEIAGHLIGKFPHENIRTEIFDNYIRPENETNIFELEENGTRREWILEIYFVDRKKEIGGFFEQLLHLQTR